MNRLFRTLALMLVVVLLAGACSSAKDSWDANTPGGGSDGNSDNSLSSPRQIIYQAWLTVAVENLDTSVGALGQEAAKLGGFVSGSVRNNQGDEPWARITYRIPQADYEQFLAFARTLGRPGQETISSTDVTEEYVDLEARLANRLRHEEGLAAMFTQATSVEQLLQIERELARVREDIEVVQGRLRYLNEKISLATIEISLYQRSVVTEIPGLRPVGLRETLRRSLKALVTSSTLFLDFISFLFVALAALLPFALPLVLVIYLIVRARRRKKIAA